MFADNYTLIMLVAFGAIMYFLMIRPQSKQRKERAAMMNSLKKGDRVVTIGGIHGILRAIKDDRVTLEVASEVYVQFTKSAIASILRSDDKASSAPEPETVEAEEAEDDGDYVIEKDED